MNTRHFILFIISQLYVLPKGKAQAIPMTFYNGSLKSIPLNIPGIMNPNLSPLSNSGITLEAGQKVYYFPNGKKGKKNLLFSVTSDWQKDTVLHIHEIIRQKKKFSE